MSLNEHSPIRLGVIGLGLIAQAVHLQNLRTLSENFTVTHLCDLSRKLADALDCEWRGESGNRVRVSTHAGAVLADDHVDAVLILTPGSHSSLTRKALIAGKHVLAEKPFSHTVEEAEALDELASAQDLVLQVGYMKMYDPIMPRVRAELQRIGIPRVVRVSVLHPADDPQFNHQRYLRFDDVDTGAVAEYLRDEGAQMQAAVGQVQEPFRSLYRDVMQGSVVHEMAVLRALFGDQPLHIAHAQLGSVVVGKALTEPPQLQAVGSLGELQLSLSWNRVPGYPDYQEEILVIGSAGSVCLNLPGPYLRDHRAMLQVQRFDGTERSSEHLQAGHHTGFVLELLAFQASITAGAPVLSSAAGSAWDSAGLQQIIVMLAEQYGVADSLGGEVAGGRDSRA